MTLALDHRVLERTAREPLRHDLAIGQGADASADDGVTDARR